MELSRGPNADVRYGDVLEVEDVGETPDLVFFVLQSGLEHEYDGPDEVGCAVPAGVEHLCNIERSFESNIIICPTN